MHVNPASTTPRAMLRKMITNQREVFMAANARGLPVPKGFQPGPAVLESR